MTLRQEVEVHEIHAESDYDEDDEGPVAPGSQDGSLSQLLISRNRKEPFENLPRPSSHHSVLQTPASPLPPVPEFPARQVVAADAARSPDADHAQPRGALAFNMAAYLDPHGKAITFQALRRCLESAGPCGLSGESGGSEGLASATTDNRPMSIDVYRAPAPGPSAPKPPGQPAIGGGLV